MPGEFLHGEASGTKASSGRARVKDSHDEIAHDGWQWIAVAVFLLCWLAESALCASGAY